MLPVAILAITLAANGRSFERPWQILPEHGGKLADIITGGSAICATMIAVLCVCVVVASLAIIILTGPIARRRPDIEVTRLLISLVRRLHRSPRSFDTVRVKTIVCWNLEQTAIYLQSKLPAALALTDPFAKKGLQEKCDDGAAYLRQLQVRVALANDSTLSELRIAAATYVAILIESRYGLLPTEKSAVFRQTRAQRTNRLLKTLLVAVIPIGCLIGVRYAGVKLSGPLYDWVVIVALLWAAISFISLIDPTYKSRIDDMGNILSVFRQDRGQ